MITEENTLLIIAVTLVFMVITTFLVLFLIRRRIGTRVVETEVNTNSQWSLGTVAEPGKKYNLCFKFKIEYPGGDDDYQLVADYMCQAGMDVLVNEKAGVGNLSSLETNRLINTQYNCDLTAILGWNKYRATIVLCSVGPFDEMCEIRTSGRIAASHETLLKKGEIFLSTYR